MSIIQIHTQHSLLEDKRNVECKIVPPFNKGRFTPHGTARNYTVRHDKTRHDTARHDTARHDTARHDTARHDTAR